ncbi:MAG: sn-glycerol-1-phosphate dehydrogenase [Kiritimatiellia bacterium]|jgi:glycerol-1-phosphate dehydrogenase [NAD(P)+]
MPTEETTGAAVSARIQKALESATETRMFWLGDDVLSRTPQMFKALFPGRPACLVADPNTFAAAGREVHGACRAAGVDMLQPCVFEKPPHADQAAVEAVHAVLKARQAVAVAVGAGTINDICKLASEQLDTGYLCVPTAASVDGYASHGAPMTIAGFKKTVPCRAPLGIAADVDVLRHAPYELTASGYADLMAKVTGGADWIIADMLGAGNESAIHEAAWSMVQDPLPGWLNRPRDLKEGDPSAFEGLFEGLALSGFAMQAARSSRPASGCEHMFSHVWEMAGLRRPDGSEPSHGFKVGIGTLAALAIMEHFFATPFTRGDIEEALMRYPAWEGREAAIRELFGHDEAGDRVVAESKAKHLGPAALRRRLEDVADGFSALRARVDAQLMPWMRMREMLRCAGCPVTPGEIGLSNARCGATVIAAQMIRSRYTVLDLAYETGRFHEAVRRVAEIWDEAPTAEA